MAELFPIAIDVEETAVGRVLRLLNRMPGIAKVHLFLSQNKEQVEVGDDPVSALGSSFRSVLRRNRQPERRGGPFLIASVLAKTPAHLKILAAALERGGLSPAPVHAYLHKMGKRKFVQRTAPGTYKLTEKGRKFFLSEDHEEVTSAFNDRSLKRGAQFGAKSLVLKALSGGEKIPLVALRHLLQANSYTANSVYNIKNRLVDEGLIEYKHDMCSITDAGLAEYTKPNQTTDNSNTEGLAANG